MFNFMRVTGSRELAYQVRAMLSAMYPRFGYAWYVMASFEVPGEWIIWNQDYTRDY